MTRAKAEVRDASVSCDEAGCAFTQKTTFARIPEWHKKPCPTCGKGEIVNDEDMAVWNELNTLLYLSNPLPAAKLGQMVEIKLDTAPLRRKP